MACGSPRSTRSARVGGSSLGGVNHYDQVALFPTETTELEQIAVFDFDNAVFKDVFERRPRRSSSLTRAST